MCPGKVMSAHDDSVRRHQDFLIAHDTILKEPRGLGDACGTDAHRSILAAPERSAGAFGRTQAVLSEKNFFAGHHRIIFREMVCLSSGGSALDSGTLKSALETRGLLDQIGGVAYLGRLTEGVPYSGNFEHYARIVKDRAIRHALMARHILATQACTNGHETSELLETGVAPYRETLAADLEARRRVQPTLEVMAGYSVSVARGPGRKSGRLFGIWATPRAGSLPVRC